MCFVFRRILVLIILASSWPKSLLLWASSLHNPAIILVSSRFSASSWCFGFQNQENMILQGYSLSSWCHPVSQACASSFIWGQPECIQVGKCIHVEEEGGFYLDCVASPSQVMIPRRRFSLEAQCIILASSWPRLAMGPCYHPGCYGRVMPPWEIILT